MSGLAGILGLHDLMALENWLSYSYRDDYASEGAGRGSVEFSCSGGQVAVFWLSAGLDYAAVPTHRLFPLFSGLPTLCSFPSLPYFVEGRLLLEQRQ